MAARAASERRRQRGGVHGAFSHLLLLYGSLRAPVVDLVQQDHRTWYGSPCPPSVSHTRILLINSTTR